MAAQSSERAPRTIRRSDVVFMYDNPAMYEPYGCTVLGWGGHANRERIQLAHAKGRRSPASGPACIRAASAS